MTPFWLLLATLIFSCNEGDHSEKILDVSASRAVMETEGRYRATVKVEVKEGFHIQADSVTVEFLIPTMIMFEDDSRFVPDSVVFPEAVDFTFEGIEEQWKVFDGSFDVLVVFHANRDVAKGAARWKGNLRYQACDRVRCYSPRSADFEIPVDVR